MFYKNSNLTTGEKYTRAQENTANKGTSNDDLNFIPLGQYFEDKDIKRLLPYEGDYLLEGRHGHSIRFGSTTPYNPDEKGLMHFENEAASELKQEVPKEIINDAKIISNIFFI